MSLHAERTPGGSIRWRCTVLDVVEDRSKAGWHEEERELARGVLPGPERLSFEQMDAVDRILEPLDITKAKPVEQTRVLLAALRAGVGDELGDQVACLPQADATALVGTWAGWDRLGEPSPSSGGSGPTEARRPRTSGSGSGSDSSTSAADAVPRGRKRSTSSTSSRATSGRGSGRRSPA